MDESLEGLAWLLATLKADATVGALAGGVWHLRAPLGTPLPFCVVTSIPGQDVMAVAGQRLMYEGTYAVRIWGYAAGQDTTGTLNTAVNAADTALHRHSGSTSRAQILSCLRDHPLPVLPDEDGQQLRIGIGGLYRLQICPL